jgi:GNAT superfamily N-acetyltransferase
MTSTPEQPMQPDPPRPLTGIVFRRLRSWPEHAAAGALLAGCGVPPTAGPGRAVLFGLWDLAAPAGDGLVGVAVTRAPDDGRSVELCGVAVPASLRRQGLGRRLVAEVADAWRAEGAQRLVARSASGRGGPPDDRDPVAGLLARTGFVAAGADAGDRVYLDL